MSFQTSDTEITKWGDDTGCGVVMAMKLMFARHSVPDVVTSDNGSRFKDFTESREFKHTSDGLMVNQKKKHTGYKNEKFRLR